MRASLFVSLMLMMSPAISDDLFLQASGAESTVSSQRYAVTRTFDGNGPGFEAGLSHFNGDDA
ncbi:MAG: hypothetical protein R3288_15725, partial [Woeseiaceae bacterium]|nr:hypothetical protein [Woeseiaceae bacterium]